MNHTIQNLEDLHTERMETLGTSLTEIVNYTSSSPEAPQLFAAFSRDKWERGSAWNTLHTRDREQIWRKAHTATHWCWYASIGETWDTETKTLIQPL